MDKSSFERTTRNYVGMKRKQTRLKLQLVMCDDGRSRKTLVDTKAYAGVCKDQDEEKYSSNDILEKSWKYLLSPQNISLPR